MKAFTTEVWILPVSTTPIWPNGLSFRDIHENYRIYLDTRSPTVRPLYIGFRFNGKLETLNRVLSIEHEVAVSKYVPDLESAWKDKPHTIWLSVSR